jgi:capsular polysaccharide export protein
MTPSRIVLPRNLRVLFPELESVRQARSFTITGRMAGRPVRLQQGLLAAPPFKARNIWTSGEIVDETAGPPDEEAAAHGLALLRAIAHAKVGGPFWAPPSSTQRPVVAILPDMPKARDRMRDYIDARHPADMVLYLEDGSCDPWSLLATCDTVHVAGQTPFALLALAAQRRLICHAPVALSGWGVTEDLAAIPRKGNASLGALAAWQLLGGRYADPFHDRISSPENTIALLADWRQTLGRKQGIAGVAGIGFWKKRHVRALIDSGQKSPAFARSTGSLMRRMGDRPGAILAWPSTMPRGLPGAAAAKERPVWQIEDGFIRSAGLGVHGVPPCSVVIDRQGIYYDPATPSELERILAHSMFTPDILARANALRDTLVARGFSKYNVGKGAFRIPAARRTILVPGQVTDDASVRRGGLGITSNLELLERVRARAPDACILYKPHPDVASGHRAGAIRRKDAIRYADTIVTDVAISALLDQVDEVHTLTSLTGFEALLRHKHVVTYGHPFYAGWGLTEDAAPFARRTRRLSLAELVAGALILYPFYLDPVTMLPCPPELLLERLQTETGKNGLTILFRRALGRTRRWRRNASDWC